MARPSNNFKKLADVPVHYDRLAPPYSYGTRGKPTKFHTTEEFQKKLDSCFSELWDVCPFGTAEVITSAGAYTAKPGWHGKGKAFDLDGIFWSDKKFITLNYTEDPKFYLGVEAVLRKHFGTILNYHYNASHRDHFHIQDDGKAVGFRNARSIIVFLQAALSRVFGEDVEVNGKLDSKTDVAIGRMLETLDIDGDFTDKESWLDFLTKTSVKCFGTPVRVMAGPEATPLELLNELYSVLAEKLADSECRKSIESVLNRFAEHEETEKWLDTFRI